MPMPPSHANIAGSSSNLLLRRLSSMDRALLERHLQAVEAPSGLTVMRIEDPLQAVFFPNSGMLSLREMIGDDRSVEVGIVGREGLIGWPALLGAQRSSHCATVCTGGGTLLRIGIDPLRMACRQSPSLQAALLQFVHVFIVQATCAIASHLEHSLGQRVARWLLMRHDRVGGDILLALHDEVAASLNVRRASITDQLHLLEGRGLIRCTRGRIIVRDRAQLELFAAGAYGIAEEHYRALIAPFGKSAARQALSEPLLAERSAAHAPLVNCHAIE